MQLCPQAADLCLSFQAGSTPESDLKQWMMASGTLLTWHSCFVNLALLLCIILILKTCTLQLLKPESPTSLQTPDWNPNKSSVVTAWHQQGSNDFSTVITVALRAVKEEPAQLSPWGHRSVLCKKPKKPLGTSAQFLSSDSPRSFVHPESLQNI